MNANHQITVIIADDEKAIRDGLKSSIAWDDLNTRVIDVLSDGKQALDSIIENKPDICIIDICMPELTGLEVIRRCKEKGIDTEFLILSGYNDFTYAQEAIHCGAKGYLLKPINLDKLMNELYNLCRNIIDKKSLNVNIDLLRRTSKIHVLNHIINGGTQKGQIASFDLIDFKITNSPNRVIVCSLNDKVELDETNLHEENALALLEHAHYPVPCELWSPRANEIVFLFNDETKDLFLARDIAKFILFKLNPIKKSLKGIGIGDLVNNLQSTSYSYNRAQLALSYQMYSEMPAIHDPMSICDVAPDLSPTNIEYAQLTEAILAADHKGIQQYLETFFKSLFYVPKPPPTFVKGMSINLIMNILKDLSLRTHNEKAYPKVSYDELNQLSSFSELSSWLLGFFIDCSKLSQELLTMSIESDDIIDKAKYYIHDNLLKNIRIKDIANHVNLSESYFAAYFKQKTGINLRDYLLNCKIEYAKTRIRDHKVAISEVAYELGYTDYRSFSRAFKNVTSKSPSEYQ